MKKLMLLFVVIAIIFACTSCNIFKNSSSRSNSSSIKQNVSSSTLSSQQNSIKSDASSNTISYSNDDNSNYTITQEQASDIIAKKIDLSRSISQLMFQGTVSINNKKYYVVRAFDDMGDHIATFAWLWVDVNSGKMFEEFAARDDVLIPRDNMKEVNQSNNSAYESTRNTAINILVKYLSLPNDEKIGFQGEYERQGKRYNVVYDFNKISGDVPDFYLIDTDTNKIYKWDIQNDKLIETK